jgi:hypothetical protein
MGTDSLQTGEYVEFVVIGSITTLALVILTAGWLGMPFSQLSQINPLFVVILLPFTYVLGMLLDRVSQLYVWPLRLLIRNRIFGSTVPCTDEYIARVAPDLYYAYDSRMRRVRVVGTAVINWLLLGLAVLVELNTTTTLEARTVEFSSVALSVLSLLAFLDLTRRAYQFRKHACEAVSSTPILPRATSD